MPRGEDEFRSGISWTVFPTSLLIIASLAGIYYVYTNFGEFDKSVALGIVAVAIIIAIWNFLTLIRLRRYRPRKVTVGRIFCSLILVALVWCTAAAFTGIQPLPSIKDRALNFIEQNWQAISESLAPAPVKPPPALIEPLPAPTPATVPTPEPIEPAPAPTAPSIPVKPPVYQHEQLIQYALELINKDRVANGLLPVALGSNFAAQKHAEERLANKYCSHWDMDGMKPYMRYTLAGGVNYESENGFVTETIWFGEKDPSYRRDPKEMLKRAQEGLMDSQYHKKNILNKWHKKVNLGIAYNEERLDLVQQFEGDYVDFSKLPTVSGNILSMAGKVTIGNIEQVAVHYDSSPKPLSPEQLNVPPYNYAYGLGEDIGTVVPPLPPGYFYTDLSSNDVIAMTWDIGKHRPYT